MRSRSTLTTIALALLPALGQGQERSPDEARLIRALHSVRVAQPPPLEPLAAELAVAAGREQDFLLDVLVDRAVPPFGEEPQQVLSETQEALILRTLAGRQEHALRRWALAQIATDEPQERAAGLLVLSAAGDSASLQEVLKELGDPDADKLSRGERRAALLCMSGILARDRGGLHALESGWDSLSDSLMAVATEAIAHAGRPEGLQLLGELLLERPALAQQVLPRVRALTPAPRRSLVHEVAEAARELLVAEDTSLRSSACLVAGDIEDMDSIPDLLNVLETGTPSDREAAVWALRRIGGTSLVASPEVWRAWHASEMEWHASDFPKCQNALRSNDKARVGKALREVSLHPLYRHELVASIAPVLRHRSRGMRAAAAQILTELASPTAVPALIDALEDVDPEVRETAHAGLRALTGLDAPADPDPWFELAIEHGYLTH